MYMKKYTCPLYAKGTCKKGNKCKMHHGPTENELCQKINSFVTELKSTEHINFAGLDIEETICNFFEIIERDPNFLNSYLESKEMPLFKPLEFAKCESLFEDSFNLFRDYCLVLKTISYINDKKDFNTSNTDEIKEYIFNIYSDKIQNCHKDDFLTNDKIYINTKQYPHVLGIIPEIGTTINYHTLIVESLKEFITTITKNYSYIETPKKNNTKIEDIIIDFASESAIAFISQKNIEKIIMYPYISDKKWFYSIINFPEGNTTERMHNYIMNIKKEIKYGNTTYIINIDFYSFVSRYNIPKNQQQKILASQHDPTYVSSCGICYEVPNSLTIGTLYSVTYDANGAIGVKIDREILNNNKINLNDYNIKILLEQNGILPNKIDWLIAKLQQTDYSNMNIIDAIKYYKNQLKIVIPNVIKKSFCSLDLNMDEYMTILKKYIETENRHGVCINNNNIVVKYENKMIEINEEAPTFIHIEFDMPYCLLCKEIYGIPKINTNFRNTKKVYDNVKQPYFCSSCHDMIGIVKPHLASNSFLNNGINFNQNIMELTLIDKKLPLIIFGFKHDDKTIFNTLVMDVLKLIIMLYVDSINFQ